MDLPTELSVWVLVCHDAYKKFEIPRSVVVICAKSNTQVSFALLLSNKQLITVIQSDNIVV